MKKILSIILLFTSITIFADEKSSGERMMITMGVDKILQAQREAYKADYLSDDQQLNLERAFLELSRGLEFIVQRHKGIDRGALENQLNSALFAYREGNVVQGAHLLQEFERTVFS